MLLTLGAQSRRHRQSLLLRGLLFVLACYPQLLELSWPALAAGGSGNSAGLQPAGSGPTRPVWRGKQLVGLPSQLRLKRAPRSTGQSAATDPTFTSTPPTTTATAKQSQLFTKTLERSQVGQAKQQQVQSQQSQLQLQHKQKQRSQSNAMNSSGRQAESGGAKEQVSSDIAASEPPGARKQPRLLGSDECEYEKGAWEACQSNGLQQRTLRLRKRVQLAAAASGDGQRQACEPIKIMRRECRLGCKYVRGEWSATCADGVRVRIDTLVGTLPPTAGPQIKQVPDGANQGQLSQQQQQRQHKHTCQPQRKVTKDCGRACHYVKSSWSECTNGFKTRNLTLETGAPPSANCAKEKQVKRQCRSNRPAVPKLTRLQRKRLRLQQQQQQPAPVSGSGGGQPGLEAPVLPATSKATTKATAHASNTTKRRKR